MELFCRRRWKLVSAHCPTCLLLFNFTYTIAYHLSLYEPSSQRAPRVYPWCSLVEGDEAGSAQAESCCVYVKCKKFMQHMHGIIQWLFDCWADPVVYLFHNHILHHIYVDMKSFVLESSIRSKKTYEVLKRLLGLIIRPYNAWWRHCDVSLRALTDADGVRVDDGDGDHAFEKLDVFEHVLGALL